MIIKIIGGIIVILSCIFISRGISNKHKRRLTELFELKKAFGILCGEINYNLSPLPEAFISVGNKLAGELKTLFINTGEKMDKLAGGNLYEIWCDEINNSKKRLSLNNDDLTLLSDAGKNLGFLDVNMQVGSINLFLEQLDNIIANAIVDTKNKEKLYNSLGVLGGILIVILLI